MFRNLGYIYLDITCCSFLGKVLGYPVSVNYNLFILVDDRLDDEDYEIIRENTGIEVPKVLIM